MDLGRLLRHLLSHFWQVSGFQFYSVKFSNFHLGRAVSLSGLSGGVYTGLFISRHVIDCEIVYENEMSFKNSHLNS
jgi:hypothetical protein